MNEKMDDENKGKGRYYLIQFIKLFIIGLLVINTMYSLAIYMYSAMSVEIYIESFWYAWWYGLIGLASIPIILIIDGIFSDIFALIKINELKPVFLFVSKVFESLTLIYVLYLADNWLKGVDGTIWSAVVIGYTTFLVLEVIFILEREIVKNLRNKRSQQKNS